MHNNKCDHFFTVNFWVTSAVSVSLTERFVLQLGYVFTVYFIEGKKRDVAEMKTQLRLSSFESKLEKIG